MCLSLLFFTNSWALVFLRFWRFKRFDNFVESKSSILSRPHCCQIVVYDNSVWAHVCSIQHHLTIAGIEWVLSFIGSWTSESKCKRLCLQDHLLKQLVQLHSTSSTGMERVPSQTRCRSRISSRVDSKIGGKNATIFDTAAGDWPDPMKMADLSNPSIPIQQ